MKELFLRVPRRIHLGYIIQFVFRQLALLAKVRVSEGALRLSLKKSKAEDAGLGLSDPPFLKRAGKANGTVLPYSFSAMDELGSPYTLLR